ncbi:LysM peptidoglycan-binding domain-containing protein [Enterococcus faecium]|uniref:LysM peptidoglycan-binding domain-containing protein n=1 Tax=Enterococcus faecium TaxID=1352 RepID=UPI0022E29401|nr:LysM peptidoglycan-binding domain-containing protein [Enterococcus faecium]
MYDENEWGENVRMTRRRQQKQAARKRMIMIGAAVAVFLIIAGGVAGLYFHGKNSSEAKSTTITETTTKKTETKQTSESSTKTKETQTSEEKTANGLPEQLQAILNHYTKKIEETTPALIEEYQTEIQGNQEGIAGLSAVANQKARELQAISDEGIRKLRAAYQAAENKDGVDLDTLINQLSANYTNHVAKISDIYLQTSASLQAESTSTQDTTSSDSETAESVEASEMQARTTQDTTDSSETNTNSATSQAATTVVLEGEGPNQIAERTGVPVETILSLNGMSMENYFLTPGETLKLN